MKKYICAALVLTIMSSCSSTKSQSSDKGFIRLFDGMSTTGWHTYGKNSADAAWRVEDGTLHFDPAAKEKLGNSDLVTDKEYSDFHLKVDWRIAAGSNSGIVYLVQEDVSKYPHTHSTGLEMQVLDNDRHKDGKKDMHRAGDLYDLMRSSSEPVNPVGEWNTAEIISKAGKIEHFLNGVRIISVLRWDENWKKLVANSKFKKLTGWGSYRSGKIALQDHGDDVWYRNIMIKEL